MSIYNEDEINKRNDTERLVNDEPPLSISEDEGKEIDESQKNELAVLVKQLRDLQIKEFNDGYEEELEHGSELIDFEGDPSYDLVEWSEEERKKRRREIALGLMLRAMMEKNPSLLKKYSSKRAKFASDKANEDSEYMSTYAHFSAVTPGDQVGIFDAKADAAMLFEDAMFHAAEEAAIHDALAHEVPVASRVDQAVQSEAPSVVELQVVSADRLQENVVQEHVVQQFSDVVNKAVDFDEGLGDSFQDFEREARLSHVEALEAERAAKAASRASQANSGMGMD